MEMLAKALPNVKSGSTAMFAVSIVAGLAIVLLSSVPADAAPAPVTVEVIESSCHFSDPPDELPHTTVRATIDPVGKAIISLYSDAGRTNLVGTLNPSDAFVDLAAPGTYYWNATAVNGFEVVGPASGEFTVESPCPYIPKSRGTFVDDDTSIFEEDIEWLADQGITKGCNAAERLFCPDDFVTRGQMAAFLVRALGYTDNGGGDLFTDDDGHTFENDIDKLGTAGVTKGCNPPDNDRFCPDDRVTRGAMAAFLVRALGYTDNGGGNLFIDDDGSTFENDIDRLATAGVTKGCNPPVNDKFCPNDFVTRGQMAAFLHRALG
jgi:hypothetical protein